jgi:hypothetical protein
MAICVSFLMLHSQVSAPFRATSFVGQFCS